MRVFKPPPGLIQLNNSGGMGGMSKFPPNFRRILPKMPNLQGRSANQQQGMMMRGMPQGFPRLPPPALMRSGM
jgi:hypothetical protein